MPVFSITALNVTATDVVLNDLGVTVPASSSLVLTEGLFSYEILSSDDLLAAINTSQIVLDIGSGPLSQERSLEILSRVPTAEGVVYDPSASNLSAVTMQEALDEAVTSIPARIDTYDNTGGQQFTSSLVIVRMDVVRQNVGGVFDLQPDGRILCNRTGSFRVGYDVSLGLSGGSGRSNSESFLYLNGSEVPGTRRACYNRIVGNDESSATGHAYLDLVPGDLVDVRVRRFTGPDTCVTVQSSSLEIEEFKGSQGVPGQDGSDGSPGIPGPPGSGSNINVAASGIVVPTGPFSIINFDGFFRAVDVGGGQVDVSTDTAGILFPPSPSDGQQFYRTDLQWEFRFDATRGKWLGTTVEFEGGGFNGSVSDGYFRRFNGMTTSDTLGTWIPYDITVVGITGKWDPSATGELQVRRNGVAVASVSYTNSVFASDLTLNDDFDANGNMSFYVSGSLSTPQMRVWYRRRAT